MTTPVPEQTPQPPDAAVEAEWRKIEQERIAEEVEEAREDTLEAGVARERHWPWGAIAAALVAGMVLAALLNSPWFRRPVEEPGQGVQEAGE